MTTSKTVAMSIWMRMTIAQQDAYLEELGMEVVGYSEYGYGGAPKFVELRKPIELNIVVIPLDAVYNCTTCYWWRTESGCNSTNWTTGKLTNPEEPVCGYLSEQKLIPMSWRKKET